MKCPRCLVPLDVTSAPTPEVGVGTRSCPKCTGHWLEAAELRDAEQVVDVRLIAWRHLPGDETQGRALFCPRCAPIKVMDKVVSDRDKRVVMDVCALCHGVWLDYGELEAIQQKGLLATLADVLDFIRKG